MTRQIFLKTNSEVTEGFHGRISEIPTCLICSQTNLVTEDPE